MSWPMHTADLQQYGILAKRWHSAHCAPNYTPENPFKIPIKGVVQGKIE